MIYAHHINAVAMFVVNEIKKMEESCLLDSRSTIALIYRTNTQSCFLEEACVAGNLKYSRSFTSWGGRTMDAVGVRCHSNEDPKEGA